jgi:hypothetical protein
LSLNLQVNRRLFIRGLIYRTRLLGFAREIWTKENSFYFVTSHLTSHKLVTGVIHVNFVVLHIDCKEKPVPRIIFYLLLDKWDEDQPGVIELSGSANSLVKIQLTHFTSLINKELDFTRKYSENFIVPRDTTVK